MTCQVFLNLWQMVTESLVRRCPECSFGRQWRRRRRHLLPALHRHSRTDRRGHGVVRVRSRRGRGHCRPGHPPIHAGVPVGADLLNLRIAKFSTHFHPRGVFTLKTNLPEHGRLHLPGNHRVVEPRAEHQLPRTPVYLLQLPLSLSAKVFLGPFTLIRIPSL